MEPETLRLAEVGHLVERVDRARVDGPRARRHAEGRRPAARSAGHGRRGAPPRPSGSRRPRARSAPRPRRAPEPRRPCGCSCGPPRRVEDEGRRGARDAARPDVPAVRGRRPVAGGRQAGEGRRGAAADQEAHAALGREADELHQPPHGRALDVDRGVVPARAARVRGPTPRKSATMPRGAGGELTQPKKRGCPLPMGWAKTSRRTTCSSRVSGASAGLGQRALQQGGALRGAHRREDRPLPEAARDGRRRGRRPRGRAAGRCPGRLPAAGGRRAAAVGVGVTGFSSRRPASARPRRACGPLSTSAMAR